MIARHYQCPDCGGTFRFNHHPNNEPPPNFCPLCGNDMRSPEPVFMPAAPAIRNPAVQRGVDETYRHMEEGAAARMEYAAQIGSGSASDYAALKLTDMPDNVREGDFGLKSRPNPISDIINAGQGGFNPIANQAGASFAAAVGSGLYPYRGQQVKEVYQNHFRNLAPQLFRRDEQGKY